jgi:hypothetical protein
MCSTRSVWGTALIGAALVGCASPDRGAPGKPEVQTVIASCGSVTTVTITAVDQRPEGHGTITISADPVVISSGKATVAWNFASGLGYQFQVPDGISFKPAPPPQPPGAAPTPSSASGTGYSWCFDSAPNPRPWRYSIKFQSTNAPTTFWECDPTIANQGGSLGVASAIACTWHR